MRGKQAPKRKIDGDLKYNDTDIAKFINYIMERGKKAVAQKIVYDAFDIINTRLRPNHTAVVVLGGEPTFHDNLPSLLQHIKTTGRKTKVFTNGLGAKSIDDCVPYLDSCSVDFKTSLNPAVLGVDISIKSYMRRVKDTLNVLKHSLIPTEVRTTTAPGITDIDVEQITTLLALTYPDMEHIIQEYRSIY